MLIVPFAGGWRVDLNLLVDDDSGRYVSPEGLRHWIPRVLPASYGERVRWVSTYRFAQQVAATFTDTHRRVLLTGEASHLFAPFGARGMNSSIPDAVRAVTAVHAALSAHGAAEAEAEIVRFAEERKEAANYNRACASSALEHMLAERPSIRLRRRAAAAVASAGLKAGAWLDAAPYGPKLVQRGAARTSY
ncbi:hypothetical protein GCM10020295_00560 [Streptomyces cinereospinus]